MIAPVLQQRLEDLPWMSPVKARLPGMQPLEMRDWLSVDEAFAGQMALRDQLIAERPEAVIAALPQAHGPAQELYRKVLSWVSAHPQYQLKGEQLTRPDGVTLRLDPTRPLESVGRMVQQDFALHLKQGAEHVLVGAVLCFPASWSLEQKIGKPLSKIHAPVAEYDANLATRVQRLFDAVRPDQPLWRANALLYEDPSLHQPRLEGEIRPKPRRRDYLRSERQSLMKLDASGAVVFTIHTRIVHISTLPSEALDAFIALHP